MESKFTHIRVSVNTKNSLDQLRATGQSYDGLLRELIRLCQGSMMAAAPLPADSVPQASEPPQASTGGFDLISLLGSAVSVEPGPDEAVAPAAPAAPLDTVAEPKPAPAQPLEFSAEAGGISFGSAPAEAAPVEPVTTSAEPVAPEEAVTPPPVPGEAAKTETTGRGACPKCGSWFVWQTMSKPPTLLCRNCGYEF